MIHLKAMQVISNHSVRKKVDCIVYKEVVRSIYFFLKSEVLSAFIHVNN